MVRLFILVVVLSFAGCASIPEGWVSEDTAYTQTKTGLSFPKQTASLTYIGIIGATPVTHSDTVQYKSSVPGLTMSLSIRDTEDVLNYGDYFGYSKIAMVKEGSLQKQLPNEEITITYQGKTYQGSVFRGYGPVITLQNKPVTVLESFMTFDLGGIYVKLRSGGPYELDSNAKLEQIRANELELLSAVFDSAKAN